MSKWRYELKFTIDATQLAQARSWLRLHPAGFVTAFPRRRVHNIYLDTPALTSLNGNLSGISERKKVRLRWYGDQRTTIRPILELKTKHNLYGDKQRLALETELDLTQPWSVILRQLRESVSAEWRSQLAAFTQPTLYNRYDRDYFVTGDGAIRATLDFNLFACSQRLATKPNLDRPNSLPPLAVIEIKGDPNQSDRLEAIAANLPIQRTRSSKYVTGVLSGSIR
ncbi:MAG: polyphosphate polymerase domain-containing protein [Anaerolineae bacterium]|nr:polyphosphate polymerase domain-containing protein [Anaerolineae bacterium]MCO5207971.1 polyphosphate polymerase domain-containing protein [Anaerolineae bacterium]